MDKSKAKTEKRIRRHNRIRSKIKGTNEIPRLNVFKSNTSIYAQIIDDVKGITLVSVNSNKMEGKTDMERVKHAGGELAKLATAKKITKVVFDRGGYIFTGKIKVLAESAREGGLKF